MSHGGMMRTGVSGISGQSDRLSEAQRSYRANSKVFQTGSELLDILVNLKR